MILQDIKNSIYSLSKVKIFVLTIISTLGITLGTLVAMFNLNYQILAAPLPYPNSSELFVSKGTHYIKGKVEFEDYTPVPMLLEAYKNEKSSELETSLFAYAENVLRHRADTPRVDLAYVTPEFMPMLGFNLALGRTFSADEGLDTMSPVAVISYQAWEKYFNKSADVIDKTLQIDAVDFRIIGVLAKDLKEPEMHTPGRITDVWLTWDFYPEHKRLSKFWGMTRDNQHLLVRAKNIESIPIINNRWNTHYNERFKTHTARSSFFDDMTVTFELHNIAQKLHGDSASRTIWLFIGALCLTLIACANIANLILARAVNQQRNMSIKAALGAQKSHLIRSIFAELILLTIMSAVISLGIAQGCYYLLKQVASDTLPTVATLGVNLASIIFCIVTATLLAALGAYLVSSKINYQKLNSQIQTSGKGTSIQIKSSTRKVLIFSQVFLASLLLMACVQTFVNSWGLLNQEPNFKSKGLYQVSLSELFTPRPATREERVSYYNNRRQMLIDIVEELNSDPRIKLATVSSGTPVRYGINTFLSKDSGFVEQFSVSGNLIDENYLSMTNLNILQGRNFTKEDVNNRNSYIIVNQKLAEEIAPNGNIIGERFFWLNGKRGVQYEVIGVTENLAIPDQADTLKMWSTDRFEVYSPSFIVELAQGQSISPSMINSIFSKRTQSWKVSKITPLEDQLAGSLALHSIAGWTTLTLASITLLIAMVGIYGVLTYGVAMRKFELGVRMAIGASPFIVIKGIVEENLKVIGSALLFSAVITLGAIMWLNTTTTQFDSSLLGFILPIVLIIIITVSTSVLSVWHIIRKPAIYSLRDQ